MAERYRGNRGGRALPFRPLVSAHTLAIDDEDAGFAPLGVAVEPNCGLCGDRRKSGRQADNQDPSRNEGQPTITGGKRHGCDTQGARCEMSSMSNTSIPRGPLP